MAESEEEVKSLLMKVKVESEKAGLKLKRRGQWASRGAPGKSGLHASGEGERVIAPEPW